ncbi:hypothetical protein ACEWY4_027787 [Coilia grayii]|uniref:Complex 1 LYR protein domain-containing protein n=1 Tax=Coilia grayii TaxID=363190 RepID=A0ABD1IQX2_9TELE
MTNPFRGQVIHLYKTLLYMGRDYPQGYTYFRQRLKAAFMKNKDVTDPEKIKKLLALRKYRAMKKRYYEPDK